eukprot:3095349-Rhodomonas_salina.1
MPGTDSAYGATVIGFSQGRAKATQHHLPMCVLAAGMRRIRKHVSKSVLAQGSWSCVLTKNVLRGQGVTRISDSWSKVCGGRAQFEKGPSNAC